MPDGTLRTWGQNDNVQLGDGSATQRTRPVQHGPATTYTRLAASGTRRADGTAPLWSWGQNTDGQLGDEAGAAYCRRRRCRGVPAGTAGLYLMRVGGRPLRPAVQ